jgi:hypothetical protein
MVGDHEDIAERQDTYDRRYTNFPDKRCRSITKIVSSRRVISNLHTLDPQILGAVVQYIVAQDELTPGVCTPLRVPRNL